MPADSRRGPLQECSKIRRSCWPEPGASLAPVEIEEDLLPESVFGLPLHPLVVHATVVIVPAAAAVLAASLLSSRFRRWAGLLPMVMAAMSVILAPLSTSTGESLEGAVGETTLVDRHARLGEMLVWWCVAMLVVATASYLMRRRRGQAGRRMTGVLLAAGLVAAGGTLVQVALVGHSGAEAVWSNQVAPAASGSSSSTGG